MADDLSILYANFDDLFPTSERKYLPVVNPFESYNDKKFRERFRLSKSVVKRLLDEVSVKLHYFTAGVHCLRNSNVVFIHYYCFVCNDAINCPLAACQQGHGRWPGTAGTALLLAHARWPGQSRGQSAQALHNCKM